MSRPDLDACPVQDRDPGTRSRRRTTSGRGVDAEHIRDSPASVESFFSRPGDFLRDIMEGLDSDARAALGLIFVHHDWLSSPVSLAERSADLVSRLGSTLGGVLAALEAMKDSLVRHLTRNEETGWVFAMICLCRNKIQVPIPTQR